MFVMMDSLVYDPNLCWTGVRLGLARVFSGFQFFWGPKNITFELGSDFYVYVMFNYLFL